MRKSTDIKATVFLPIKLNNALKKAAATRGISKTDLISNILQNVLEEKARRRKKV